MQQENPSNTDLMVFSSVSGSLLCDLLLTKSCRAPVVLVVLMTLNFCVSLNAATLTSSVSGTRGPHHLRRAWAYLQILETEKLELIH
jgi:hypothetical protein